LLLVVDVESDFCPWRRGLLMAMPQRRLLRQVEARLEFN
jgi:hypothetical protein